VKWRLERPEGNDGAVTASALALRRAAALTVDLRHAIVVAVADIRNAIALPAGVARASIFCQM